MTRHKNPNFIRLAVSLDVVLFQKRASQFPPTRSIRSQQNGESDAASARPCTSLPLNTTKRPMIILADVLTVLARFCRL